MFNISSLRTSEGSGYKLFCMQESVGRMRSEMLMDGDDIGTQSQLIWPIQFVWFCYSWVIKEDPNTSQLSTTRIWSVLRAWQGQ